MEIQPDCQVLKQARVAFPEKLVRGRLIKRYKRFLADVELAGGEVVTAHCPNSGAMTTCATPGWEVLLSPAADPGRKTRFTWEAVHNGQCWIGVNTALPNRLALEAARTGAISLFRNASEVRAEVKTGPRTRLDLAARTPEGQLYVEVKNVTLVENGVARFPDAATSRGLKHLEELMMLKRQGNRAAMLYVVQRSDAQSFTPAADIDPAYAEGLARAVNAGVEACVVLCEVSETHVIMRRNLSCSIR